MILPKFDYFSPHSLGEAVEWLSGHVEEGVAILGGGTDLLVNLRGKAIPDGHKPRCQQHRTGPWHARLLKTEKPAWLLALSRIPELKNISQEGDRIRVGSMVTHAQLERSPVIQAHLSGLADGAAQLGSPLCRNRGTYGGNLCNARPASDTSIPTLALNGELVLVSVRGERIVRHQDFVVAPGETVIRADEILKEVIFKIPSEPAASAYLKLANRKALEIAVVGAAAAVVFDGAKPGKAVVKDAKLALAAVAPKPLLVPEAGDLLVGRELNVDSAKEAARVASTAARPITDHRASAEYRKCMIEVIVRRTLMLCLQRMKSATGGAAA